MAEGEDLTTGVTESIESVEPPARYRENLRRAWEKRGISELEYYEWIIKDIETRLGILASWQQFYILAVVSGRGVEWAQARNNPHYHIMGLPCSICGRR